MAKAHKLIARSNLDTTVRPQDDFYQYANGGWIAKNPIPKEESAWGSFYVSVKQNHQRLQKLAKGLERKRGKTGTPLQLVRDFWLSGMDARERNRKGFRPIQKYVDEIEKIDSIKELVAFIAMFHRDGFSMLWGVGVGPDDKDSSTQVLHVAQDGLSLPDRDFYVKKSKENEAIKKDLAIHIERILVMYGKDRDDARKSAQTILSIEMKLALTSMTMVERRDPHAQYNPHSISQLKKLTPHIDWILYLKGIHATASRIIVGQPKFFTRLDTILTGVTLSDWKRYLLWHVILGTSSYLGEKIAQAQFDFYGTRLQGTPEMKPLWRRVISTIDSRVGDALGQLYVTEYFPPRAKKRIDELVKNVIGACAERIESLEWMTSQTKKKALQKLQAIRPKIGYPIKWEQYKKLDILPDDYLGNVVRANRYEHARAMRKIDMKPDLNEWLITAPTVNAYFHPNMNEIVFPAGILQAPAFDADVDDAVNYGGIGSIIGHEITHAFDDEGRKFDAKGNLKDWWVAKDGIEFKKRAEVLRKQYDAFEVLPGLKVNGALTLGENIADLGGLIIAYEAWKKTKQARSTKKIDGFTGAQRFFLGNALFEAGAIRPEAQKKRLVTDPHAPSKARINVPFANMDVFYEAFEVKEGDALYLPPESRARIW